MTYLVIFILLFIFALLEISRANNPFRQILFGLVYILLVCFAGLRYETGGDWNIYQHIFNQIPDLFSRELFTKFSNLGIEFGYYLLNSIIKTIGLDLQAIYFIVVLFNVTIISISLRRYTQYVICGLFIYYAMLYLQMDFIYTRQSIALSLFFFSLQYVQNKKLLKYLLCVLVATLFHRMSIFLIILYPFFNRKISAITMLSVMVVGMALVFFKVEWFSFLVLKITHLMNENLYDKAFFYVNDARYNASRVVGIGFFLNAFIMLVLCCYKRVIEKVKYGTISLNIYFFSLITYYYFFELIEVSLRFRLFFLSSFLILFPILISNYEKYLNKIILYVGISVYIFLWNRNIYLERDVAIAYNPYQNIIYHRIKGTVSTGKERLEKSVHFTDTQRIKQSKESNK